MPLIPRQYTCYNGWEKGVWSGKGANSKNPFSIQMAACKFPNNLYMVMVLYCSTGSQIILLIYQHETIEGYYEYFLIWFFLDEKKNVYTLYSIV